MQPAFSTPIPEPHIAAMPQLSGNSRHGVLSRNPAPQPGRFVCNSRTAIGLQFRCSGIVSGTVVAPNSGINITKAQAACAADVAINYGLGFIPGYNAAKAVFTLAGGNVNFVQNAMSGKSIVTFNNPFSGGTNIFWGPNALASGYNAIMQSAKNIGSGAVLDDVAKAAGTAGTIANLLNTASALSDLYGCRNAK